MFKARENECVGEEHEEQRYDGKHEQRERRVDRHDAVAPFVAGACGHEWREEIAREQEDDCGEEHDRAARNDEGPDCRVGDEDDQRNADDDGKNVGEGVHGVSLSRPRRDGGAFV